MTKKTTHRIASRKDLFASPWVRLVEKSVIDQDHAPLGDFHSLEVADYVSILAMTTEGNIPIVRQFRPAVEQQTLEFPGGLLDPGEEPGICAIRELEEETGLTAPYAELIGVTLPDPGRLCNRLWCFFAKDARPIPDWAPEDGVVVEMITAPDLHRMVSAVEFNSAPHLALYALARARGFI